jgi:hypothetical protein
VRKALRDLSQDQRRRFHGLIRFVPRVVWSDGVAVVVVRWGSTCGAQEPHIFGGRALLDLRWQWCWFSFKTSDRLMFQDLIRSALRVAWSDSATVAPARWYLPVRGARSTRTLVRVGSSPTQSVSRASLGGEVVCVNMKLQLSRQYNAGKSYAEFGTFMACRLGWTGLYWVSPFRQT